MESIDKPVDDDADVCYGLVQLNELLVRLDLYSLERRMLTIAIPRTAQERHIRDYGHKLKLGCCARRNLDVASDE